jgi:hypothetical protein
MEVRLGAETHQGPSMYMCHVDRLFPTPPPHLSADIKGEIYIRSPEEEFLSTQCCCHTVL